ncbi:HD family phosphohydrolase [Inconstantimicrobium mannanitabidum]|uniref:HD family phosphohydrolase n=1 Tax=Inconstantimicrobium mannanitabidum TaxID=1604901 RepID=UPI0021C364DA|nr:HDIG domain-containing metalloprotein [Clostridium sp. TW13]
MKEVHKKKSSILSNTKRGLIFVITFLAAYVILTTALVTKKYDLKVGEIPKTDIKAPREFVDEEATNAYKKEIGDKVELQYTLKKDVQKTSEDNIRNFFADLLSIKQQNSDDKKKKDDLSKVDIVKLDSEGYMALLALDKSDIGTIQSILIEAMGKVYATPIEEDKQSDIESAKIIIDNKISTLDYSRSLKETLKAIAYSQIRPNFFYDKEKTDEKLKEAMKNLSPVLIKKNQIIVKEGEPVTARQIQLLNSIGLMNNSKFNFIIYIALAVYILAIFILQYGFLKKEHKELYEDNSKLLLISLINILSLVLARGINIATPFLIPFAFGPMLLALLLNYKVSLVVSMSNLLLISAATGFNVESMVLGVLSTILGSVLLKKMQQRNDILYASIYMAVICSVITFSSGLLLSNNNMDVLIKAGISALGSIFSGILAIGALSFFENAFDIMTNVKLLELSNPNNPLLRKILMEAPGTYHHSMLVANLGEMAAENIGANPILTRIGAYYHDVGKTVRPIFFKENQMGKENPHDKISPDLSALIIVSHVKDGIELAEKNKIPTGIKDIIQQHHGTTLVKYFYITAKNNAENPEAVNEDEYRYPGPIPQSKEAGIIMLADSVEAAVRSINDPTKEKIEEMVEKIIKDKLDNGQLDECDLTLKDIKNIKLCFLKALNGIYHQRIEYPTDKNSKKES